MKSLIYISLLFYFPIFSQNVIHDLTNEYENLNGGWSIGNACGELPFSKFEINDLDMKGDTLQIMYSHVIIFGKIINEGFIKYSCNEAILEFKDKPLSVEKPEITKIKVFPNPATNEINIRGIEVEKLQLYDMTGRLLKDYKTVGNMHKIIISDLKSGVYFLRINDFEVKKIIKL